MWKKESGLEETEIIQNTFTAYIVTAVQRCKNAYIQQFYQNQMYYLTDDLLPQVGYSVEQDMLSNLPLIMQLESNSLIYALKGLSEKERYVFLERTLDEKGFDTLAEEMGMSYKGAAAIYYRTIKKIKKMMEVKE